MPVDEDQTPPILCGKHILRPSAVAALKQVRSQVETTEMLFVVVGKDIGADVFLTVEEATPLLDLWGICATDIQHISHQKSPRLRPFSKPARRRRQIV